MSTPDYVERRILREVASRKAAERLLEAKSLELFLKNEELQFSTGKLREQFDLIGVIMDAVPDVVITCKEGFVIETVNSASLVVLGYRPADLIGLRLTEFIPTLEEQRRALESDAFIVPDIGVRVSDGRMIAAELRGRRTRLYDKPLTVIVLHDISERKAAANVKEDIYRQLHESSRLEAVGALSSSVAHEMNTPIQFIGDNIKFIGHSLKKIYESYQHYDRLKLACEAAGAVPEAVAEVDKFNAEIKLPTLANDILSAVRETVEGIKQVRDIIVLMKEFSHPGTGKPQLNDLNLLVKSALTICRSRTKNVVAVSSELMPGPVLVSCNKTQLQQVMVNLIVNAVEAIEEDGIEDGRILVTTRGAGTHLRVEVADNGPGVPEALRERIFDPFFTTKQVGKGTGQGLALAKEIVVQQHAGRLFLQPKPGFSTCFVIELPWDQGDDGSNWEMKHNGPA
jgi:two-component system, NtrC family, sensor kinase